MFQPRHGLSANFKLSNHSVAALCCMHFQDTATCSRKQSARDVDSIEDH